MKLVGGRGGGCACWRDRALDVGWGGGFLARVWLRFQNPPPPRQNQPATNCGAHGSVILAYPGRADWRQRTRFKTTPTLRHTFTEFPVAVARSRMSFARSKGNVLAAVREHRRHFVLAAAPLVILLALLAASYGLFGSKRGTALAVDRLAAATQSASSPMPSSMSASASTPAPTAIELCGYGPIPIVDG